MFYIKNEILYFRFLLILLSIKSNMSDYTFMKTGNDLNVQPTDDEFLENIVVLVSAFSERSLQTASSYISHSITRNGITPEDLKRSMMLEMFLFKNRPNILDNAQDIRYEIFNNTDDDENEDNEETLPNMTSNDVFSENSCQCALCHCINTIYNRWADWLPSTMFEQILKKHIDEL